MGINGVSSYANTYTYGNVKNENVKPSKNSENNNYNEMVKNTDFKATVDTIGKDKIVNSSIASLKKTAGATRIEAAYLVWETSVQGKNNTDLVKKAANKAIYFAS